MSQPDPDPIDPLSEQDQEFLMDIDAWLEKLRRADRSFYNIMALEVWSIAKTMDGLIPGFWNRFMYNRQVALRQFMLKRRAERSSGNGNIDKQGEE
jgi:hypothetical protein